MWHAFVDESQSDRVRDPHTYLLGSALCDPASFDETRAAMRALLLPGQRKLHWRDESDKRRLQIAEAVAAMAVEHLVVVRGGRTGERPERRRRSCLDRLLYELCERGVTRVVMESRGGKDDRRDHEMFRVLRARKVLAAGVRLDHMPGPSEELLWLPDAICGAVTRSRSGDTTYVQAIQSRLTIVTVDT